MLADDLHFTAANGTGVITVEWHFDADKAGGVLKMRIRNVGFQ